jgi:hypothetical protein
MIARWRSLLDHLGTEVVICRVQAGPERLDQDGHLVDLEPEGAGALGAAPQGEDHQAFLAVPADPERARVTAGVKEALGSQWGWRYRVHA